MKGKPTMFLTLLCLVAFVGVLYPAAASGETFTIPHNQLLTYGEFSSTAWGDATLDSRTDVGGVSVDFAFSGLVGSGSGVKDEFEVAAFYGQNGGSHNADFTNFDGYTMQVENVGSGPISVQFFMNTGFSSSDWHKDTFWCSDWHTLSVGEKKLIHLDFDNAKAWNINDNPTPHTGGGLGWADGGWYEINAYDRTEVTSVGFEVADFTKGANPNGTIRLTPATLSQATLVPDPAASGPINCTGSSTLDFAYTPPSPIDSIRGYSVRVQATGQVSFDASDVTVHTVPGGATTTHQINSNGTNDYTIDYAILGPTAGIITAADLFSIVFHGAGDGTATVSIASATFRDLHNQTVTVDYSATSSISVDCTAPNTPTMTAEPAYTQGTSNPVAWSNESGSGATAYYCECATDPDFTSVVQNSGWIAGQTHTFSGLATGQIYYYHVKARDVALNETAYSDSVFSTQDNVKPTSSADALAAYQTSVPFTVSYTADDTTSGVEKVFLWYDFASSGTYTLYDSSTTGSFSFSAPDGDGFYEFYTIARDNVGNVENAPTSADASTTVDTAPPAGTMNINNDDAYTNSADVTLYSSINDVTTTVDSMRFSNDAGSTWPEGWVAYGGTHAWTLPSGDGSKTVDAEYMDTAGNVYATSDDITLDETDPTGTMVINSDDAYTATTSVTLGSSVSDVTSGMDVMRFSNDGGTSWPEGWVTYNASHAWTLTAGDGMKTVSAEYRDFAGNVLATSDDIELDGTDPTEPTMDAEPTYTPGTTNTVSWGAVTKWMAAPVEYYPECAEDAGFSVNVVSPGWISGTSHEFTGLDDGQIYYYRVKAEDGAGNGSDWSNVVNSTQDDTKPTSSANALSAYQTAVPFTVSYTASDTTSGVDKVFLWYDFASSGSFALYDSSTTGSFSFDAPDGDGFYEFYTIARDNVGNVEDAPTSADASTTVDTTPPGAVSDIECATGHQKVTTGWTDPSDSDLDVLEVWRAVWHDGSYASVYPEYDDDGGSTIPTRPASRAAADASGEWTLAGTADPGDETYLDDFGSPSRGVYYYEVFAKDLAGNYGPPASASDRATNYWLGDVDAATGPGGGDYDGDVDAMDLNALSSAYWCASPPSSPANECDVGPTDENGPFDIPTTDDLVDFEDLMIFAMNHGEVGAKGPERPVRLAGPAEAGTPLLGLSAPAASFAAGERVPVVLSLGGNEEAVKGVSAVLRYDPELLRLEETRAGAALSAAGSHLFFMSREVSAGEVWIDLAAMGPGRTIHGTGEMAEITFTVLSEGAVRVRFGDVEIRGEGNVSLSALYEGLDADAGGSVPAATALVGARPNPFNPSTTVEFDMGRSGHVSLKVYDAEGRIVRDLISEARGAGRHSVAWDGCDNSGRAVGSGLYFVKMQTASESFSSKVVLVR